MELVVLVVPVRVAVLEVLVTGVVIAVLRAFVLSTSPDRFELGSETARDHAKKLAVSLMGMAVAPMAW